MKTVNKKILYILKYVQNEAKIWKPLYEFEAVWDGYLIIKGKFMGQRIYIFVTVIEIKHKVTTEQF